MSDQLAPDQLARLEQISVLQAFGLDAMQIDQLLESGVTVEQLRGMLQLKRCEGAPAVDLAKIAARIDRIEELDQLSLDSHTT